jgi:hypothetical protein
MRCRAALYRHKSHLIRATRPCGPAGGGAGPGRVRLRRPMTFKLIESAQERWRAVNAPHLVALVRAGTRFEKGVLVEREEANAA